MSVLASIGIGEQVADIKDKSYVCQVFNRCRFISSIFTTACD